MICSICGEDINAKGMDNLSPISGFPVCEACAESMTEAEWNKLKEEQKRLDYEFATCDDCACFDECFNACFQGKICGDFEEE